jgi:hypothetical protein
VPEDAAVMQLSLARSHHRNTGAPRVPPAVIRGQFMFAWCAVERVTLLLENRHFDARPMPSDELKAALEHESNAVLGVTGWAVPTLRSHVRRDPYAVGFPWTYPQDRS